jgi:hypothetical protein
MVTGETEQQYLRANYERFSNAIRVITLIIVVIIAVLNVFLLGYVINQQHIAANIADKANLSAGTIADCTTPGGACYKRNQVATQKAIKQITDELEQLEQLRRSAANQITANQTALQKSLLELCAVQGVTCEPLPFPNGASQ